MRLSFKLAFGMFVGSGAAFLLSHGAANAATTPSTTIAINAPVAVCANSLGVLGHGTSAGCAPVAVPHIAVPVPIGANNTIVALNAPVTVSNNGVHVLDFSTSTPVAASAPLASKPAVTPAATPASTPAATPATPVAVPAPTTTSGSTPSAGTGGIGGVATGNTTTIPVNAPITACGNDVGVLSGPGGATCASAPSGPTTTAGTPGANGGVVTGNTTTVPVNAPVTACGNTIGALSRPNGASCAVAPGGPTTTAGSTGTAGGTNNRGVVAGNTTTVPVNAPVTVCGNTIGGGSSVCSSAPGGPTTTAGPSTGSTTNDGGGTGGVASGNNTTVPVNAPTTACGNTVGLLSGDSHSACTSAPGGPTTTTGAAGGGGAVSSGGLIAGDTTTVPVDAPVNACGNAADVIGRGASAQCDATTAAPTTTTNGGSPADPTGTSGNTITVPVTAPVMACGNAASVVGETRALCSESTATPTNPGGGTINVPITAPATVCGTGVGVLGDAGALCVASAPMTPVAPTTPTTPTTPVLPVQPAVPAVPPTAPVVPPTAPVVPGEPASSLVNSTPVLVAKTVTALVPQDPFSTTEITGSLPVTALAFTGSNSVQFVELALVLLTAGLGLILISRRRTGTA